MADPRGRSVDKRLVYLGMMLLTLVYPLVVLTIIVSTQNDEDDEGNKIKPLPQVSCPVEGAEGDIDCVNTPLAYAHIDSIVWTYFLNEFVMHSSYVLYTKLWATSGIVFGFWREFFSIIAFLGPELGLNSSVYLLQTLPFVRDLLPSLKTTHFPLLISFIIGAVLSTFYGLGTAQTTDQFRRTVTLAGPGTMFLFVDWFSRSVFLPFFELMQNTFTQLKVNTFLLAIFELVLTNLYGSLFLPATQKLCVVLARFFYNVSYGVDSKVSLYDHVNLRSDQDGLNPSNSLSRQTKHVIPSDTGTYQPDECRNSYSSRTTRRHRRSRSLRGNTGFNVGQLAPARSERTRAHNIESPQRTLAASEPLTNAAVVQINHDGVSGIQQAWHQPTPQKRNDRTGEKQRGQKADRKREGEAGHNTEHDERSHVSAHRKGVPENGAKRDTAASEKARSNAARVSRSRNPQLDDCPLSAPTLLQATDGTKANERRERGTELDGSYICVPKGASSSKEERRESGRSKHAVRGPDAQTLTIFPAAGSSLEPIDVEVGRQSHTLCTSANHFLAATQWTGTDANDDDSCPGYINESSAAGNIEDDASEQGVHEPHNYSQRDRLGMRSLSVAVDAKHDATEQKSSSDHIVTPDAIVCQGSAPEESVYRCMSAREYPDGVEGLNKAVDAGRGRVCPSESPQRLPSTGETADKNLVKEYDLNLNKQSSPANMVSTSSRQRALEEHDGACELERIAKTLPGGSQVIHRVSNMVTLDSPQVLVQRDERQGSVTTRSDKGDRRRSSMPRPLADEGHEEALRGTPAAGGEYIQEHVRAAHKKRHSAVEPNYGQGDDDVEEPCRRPRRKRQSAVGADYGGGNYPAEEPVRKAHEKRQSAIRADFGDGDDHMGEPTRRAHGKRPSATGADYGDGNNHTEEPTRRPRKKRQSAVGRDSCEGDAHVGEPVRRAHRKKQSAIQADHAGGENCLEEPVRRAHRKRQSAAGAGYAEGADHIEEPVGSARRKRESAVGEGHEESRERHCGRSAAEKSCAEEGRGAATDCKATAKAKISRKNKKHADDDPNAALSGRAEAQVMDGPPSSHPVPFTGQNDERTDALGGAGSQNPRLSKCTASSGSLGTGTFGGSFGHCHPNDIRVEQRPFRNNIYIPYREGFGSDAMEFEKIITWFNVIWDSWRFLLLRTVMVKASNVFIFFIMIFKDFIYSLWNYCVRYDERFVLASLELYSVKSRKNKRIVKILEWFQALVVRPFFMPKCLSTTTWRSQLLFGLNAQKAQSRTLPVAVKLHSKRSDFGLRTLSHMSDNAPPDAPSSSTPQKAARGLGILLKTFFKDLGHDIAAHFKVEMELATTGFWGRVHTAPRRRLSKLSGSSVNDSTVLECDIQYAYGSELVVIRGVPVTMRSRSSRSSTTFGSGSHSNIETGRHSIHKPRFKKPEKITFRDLFRTRDDSAFRKVHAAWASQVVLELQSLIFGRTWPRLLQKLVSSLSLVVSDIFAEHTKIGLLPAYRTVGELYNQTPRHISFFHLQHFFYGEAFGLFRTFDGRVRLFLIFSFDILEVLTVWKVQSISRFYKSIKEGFNNFHDGPLLLLCSINCAGTLMNFGLLRYVRFAHIYGDKRILPDVNKMEMLAQLNLSK